MVTMGSRSLELELEDWALLAKARTGATHGHRLPPPPPLLLLLIATQHASEERVRAVGVAATDGTASVAVRRWASAPRTCVCVAAAVAVAVRLMTCVCRHMLSYVLMQCVECVADVAACGVG